MKEKGGKSKTIFEYKSIVNYFLTISFIFILMIFILLLIILSREVLSDSNLENHLLDTKSLLQELEEVENSQINLYENVSLNYSTHVRNSILSRLNVVDSDFSNVRNNISFVSIKTSNIEFRTIGENYVIITNIEPIINDQILFEDFEGQTREGIIVETEPDNEFVVLVKNEADNEEENYISIIRESEVIGIIFIGNKN